MTEGGQMSRARSRLTYANVMATLALVIAVAGGTAYAANTIGSADIINGQVKSPDIGTGQVQSVDVRDDTLANGGLTGADIKDQSGVDTCTHGAERLGELCTGTDFVTRIWIDAVKQCADYGLRLPSLSEAQYLATNYDIANLGPTEQFWTEESIVFSDDTFAYSMTDGGRVEGRLTATTLRTLCVTNPTS